MDAYDAQFQYELSLCRPAITSRTDSTEFTTCFQEFLKTNRDLIQATDSPLVKESFQRHHENAILFEEKLSHCRLIELCTLSTPEDIRAGKVLVGTNYSAQNTIPYTLRKATQNICNTFSSWWVTPVSAVPRPNCRSRNSSRSCADKMVYRCSREVFEMNSSIPVEIIYCLFVLFTVLSILFLKGKGSSLFVGHNTTKEPAFQPVKLCKALGVCLASIALLLLIAALLWNNWPKWFSWIFGIVTGGNVISITILCNLNIIFNNHRKDSGNEW